MSPCRPTSAVLLVAVVSVLLAAAPPAIAQDGPGEAPAEPTTAVRDARPEEQVSSFRRSLRTVGRDYASLLGKRRLFHLAGGLAVGGAMANSDVDADLYDDYRDWSDGQDLADLADGAKALGEAEVVAPLFVLPALALGLEDDPGQRPLGRWVRRTARGFLVGGPTLYYLQQLTGGSRPGEPEGSDWKPFEGNHGISGHAFFGAVPFLTAARQSDSRWLQAGAVTLSLLPAWSRLEEGDHFPSQVLLGWLVAWEATGAVADTVERRWRVEPVVDGDGVGMAVSMSLP